jgi:hypothetical protein
VNSGANTNFPLGPGDRHTRRVGHRPARRARPGGRPATFPTAGQASRATPAIAAPATAHNSVLRAFSALAAQDLLPPFRTLRGGYGYPYVFSVAAPCSAGVYPPRVRKRGAQGPALRRIRYGPARHPEHIRRPAAPERQRHGEYRMVKSAAFVIPCSAFLVRYSPLGLRRAKSLMDRPRPLL